MVRMLDILKLRKKQEEESSAATPPPPPPLAAKEIKQATEKPEPKPVSPFIRPALLATPAPMAKIILSKTETVPPDKIYHEMLILIVEIIRKGMDNEPVEAKEIRLQVERAVDCMIEDSDGLLAFITSQADILDDYIYIHSVNVCLLSIAIGLELSYERNKLVELGLGALLHDIGMARVLKIANKPTKLTPEEYDEIKKHPIYGVEILEQISDINNVVVYMINQHHERTDGSGYPKGFKGDEINEYARIVAIADIYDALIHPRKYRSKMLPYDALKEVVKGKDYFDHDFLKALLSKISIYPVGSFVELSSGELAMILTSNRQTPLRPIVKVIVDEDGHKLNEPRIMDLNQHVTVYIKKPATYSLQ